MLWRGKDAGMDALARRGVSSGTWLWYLDPVDETHTRLITRMRDQYRWSSPYLLIQLAVDAFDFPFMRKVLLGIRARGRGPVRPGRRRRAGTSRRRQRRPAGRPAGRAPRSVLGLPQGPKTPAVVSDEPFADDHVERAPELATDLAQDADPREASRSASASPASFSAQIWAITAWTSRRGAASSAARARARPTPVRCAPGAT